MQEFSPIIYHTDPQVIRLHGFLSDRECDHLIEQNSIIKMSAGTLFNEKYIDIVDTKYRIAKTGTIRHNSSEITMAIEQRMMKLLNIPTLGSEEFALIHYTQGGKFAHHVDYFYDETAVQKANQIGNRKGTVICYLNTIESGGETLFPKLKLTLKPVKGDIIFFNYDRHDKKSAITLHGSNGIKDEKWIVTQWLNLG